MGNIGRDPFGGPVREAKSSAGLVRLLGEVGAYGVNFHHNDLMPIDATPSERAAILKDLCVVVCVRISSSKKKQPNGLPTLHSSEIDAGLGLNCILDRQSANLNDNNIIKL